MCGCAGTASRYPECGQYIFAAIHLCDVQLLLSVPLAMFLCEDVSRTTGVDITDLNDETEPSSRLVFRCCMRSVRDRRQAVCKQMCAVPQGAPGRLQTSETLGIWWRAGERLEQALLACGKGRCGRPSRQLTVQRCPASPSAQASTFPSTFVSSANHSNHRQLSPHCRPRSPFYFVGSSAGRPI